MTKIMIIGGNAAGMSAASQIKKLKPEWQAVVLEKGNHISYAACGIPYYIGGSVSRLDQLVALTPETAVQERGIDLRLGHTVTEVNLKEKMLLIETPDGQKRESFDYLVISTGTIPLIDGISAQESERIFFVKNLEGGLRLQRFLDSGKPQNCAVIGGGYIALEMVEAFRARGLATYLLHRRNELAKTFEPEISALILKKMEAEGVILRMGDAVHALREADNRVLVETASGESAFDCAVIAAGVAPNTALFKETPLQLGLKGSIKVDQALRTNCDFVYAAGDCTETIHLVTGKPAYIPLALKANKEGFIAGVNICGGQEAFPGVVGTAILKLFDLGVARTGLTLNEADGNGFSAVKYRLSSHSRAAYYPEAGKLESIIVIERGSGRILGAQMAGPLDSVKRIDIYAAAVQYRMTLQDLYNLDLAYAPPFSPVYDPVILAARIGKKLVADSGAQD